MMKLETVPFAAAVNPSQVKGKTVIVIDVLRATSVMITALSNGADEIIPVLSIEEAIDFYQKEPQGKMLLCGERDAQKISGFHMGNSPLEYTKRSVENRTLILTTTNGTKALNACLEAEEIFIGAFLNLAALVQKVKDRSELVIVCSGTQNKFSLDDGLCAGMILNELKRYNDISTDDLGFTLLNAAQNVNDELQYSLRNCSHVKYLNEKGYKADVDYCLRLNTVPITPMFKGNSVKINLPYL